MISPEFKSTIANKNLLGARIILKNSLLIDPTFNQFEKMLTYAKDRIPNIVVPFDGGTLEDDYLKWNQALMNMELIELIDNFSNTRISHVKKVISKVMKTEAPKSQINRVVSKPYTSNASGPTNSNFTNAFTSVKSPEETPLFKRRALQQMLSGGKKITKLMQQAEQNGNGWILSHKKELESAARQILDAIEIYKHNR